MSWNKKLTTMLDDALKVTGIVGVIRLSIGTGMTHMGIAMAQDFDEEQSESLVKATISQWLENLQIDNQELKDKCKPYDDQTEKLDQKTIDIIKPFSFHKHQIEAICIKALDSQDLMTIPNWVQELQDKKAMEEVQDHLEYPL